MAAPYKTSSICFHQPIREKHSSGPASCSTTGQSDQKKKGHYVRRREKLAQWQHPELRLRLPVDPHLGSGKEPPHFKVGVQDKAAKTGSG